MFYHRDLINDDEHHHEINGKCYCLEGCKTDHVFNEQCDKDPEREKRALMLNEKIKQRMREIQDSRERKRQGSRIKES